MTGINPQDGASLVTSLADLIRAGDIDVSDVDIEDLRAVVESLTVSLNLRETSLTAE